MTASGSRPLARRARYRRAALLALLLALASLDAGAAVRRLIVTFADPELAEAARRNERLGIGRDAELSAATGSALRVLRPTVGGAWLVALPAGVENAAAEALARKLEASGVARYAAPDYPMYPDLAPNDPYFRSGQQWNLDGPYGIAAPQAWDITTGSPNAVVAVIDSGITAHPDLARVLPGYDFVSDLTSANDGDGPDPDASDPGDWSTVGECPSLGNAARDSDWHGTFVAGIIAATSNNGFGIAGVDWNASILPVRAVGSCGGTSSDILAALTWAAGLPVPGVPANTHPARVINMSLGAPGVCSPQIQSLVDAVVNAGAFITVSAGNDGGDVANHLPANCLGVSAVAATAPNGMRASYSNFGAAVAIAAPGGDMNVYGPSAGIISTWNTGKTVPESPTFASGDGTSFAAPQVAGVASLMLAVNPSLTSAQIKTLMAQTATAFPAGSDCAMPGHCGAGIVNAAAAVKAAQSFGAQGPPALVVEYYDAVRNHYFMTGLANEISALDSNLIPGWQRTGYTFSAYLTAAAGRSPVCRFYIPAPYDSHFYSASPSECAQTGAMFPSFVYEAANVFYIALPDQASGACPFGTIEVYRLYNNGMGAGPNHRYTTSPAVRAQMIAQGWVAEGYGPNQVIMCATQ